MHHFFNNDKYMHIIIYFKRFRKVIILLSYCTEELSTIHSIKINAFYITFSYCESSSYY